MGWLFQLVAWIGADLAEARGRWSRRSAAARWMVRALGLAWVAAAAFGAWRLWQRIEGLPIGLEQLAQGALVRFAGLLTQLALVIAVTSALSLALRILEQLESDPFWALVPMPQAGRGLLAAWRLFAALSWLLLAMLPGLGIWAWQLGGLQRFVEITVASVGVILLAVCLGAVVALVLAALVPARILAPLSWIVSTAALVGALVWLRRLAPERLFSAGDSASFLEALSALGGASPRPPASWLVGALEGRGALAPVAAGLIALALVAATWQLLGARAGRHLGVSTGSGRRASGLWRVVDRCCAPIPGGALLASRLRLLGRDATQSSQILYLIGLGAVYLENLRLLPMAEPLAREIAALISLGIACLMALALALRFAFPVGLLEGRGSWWWRTAPVSTRAQMIALAISACLPPLLLGTSMAAGSRWMLGPTELVGGWWWQVPLVALFASLLGLAMGPSADEESAAWLDEAFGATGIGFLAIGFVGLSWLLLAAGWPVVDAIADELGVAWPAPRLLRSVVWPSVVLAATAIIAVTLRLRMAGRSPAAAL